MAVYDVNNYRNLTLIGHGGSGKTSLLEALLHKVGVTNRLGSVADKTSILDSTEEEREKGSSIQSALAYVTRGSIHANIIDTPGSLAFTGEAIASLAAVECAVVVVSASAGIEVNTRKMYERARAFGLGVWFVINHIDAANVRFEELVGALQESFGQQCVPINLPSGGAKSVVDCFANESGEVDFGSVEDAHTAIVEAIVGADDELMEKYLGGELSGDETMAAAAQAVALGEFMPIFFTNSCGDVGIAEFLNALEAFCPSPTAGKRRNMTVGDTETEVDPNQAAPFIGQVFKVSSDPKTRIKHVGIRVHSGKLTSDMSLKREGETKGMRPGHPLRMLGHEQHEVEAGVAGDIICLAKLDLNVGDTVFSDKGGKIEMPVFPKPMFSLAVESTARGDADKVAAGLKQFEEEDPCFRFERGTGGEMVMRGMGDAQLRTYLDRLTNQYKLKLETRAPKIPYRETITARVNDVEYTHKKQTGGAGQFGRVIINLIPAERGEGYEFIDKIFGGAIDQGFRPSVDKGIRAQMAEGVLAGYPVVDAKVELIDGKTHPVDSKDIAFQVAGRGAFKAAFERAKPVLLEPIVNVEATVPTDNVGDITGDLASRRGRPLGQDMLPGNMTTVRASVPLAELADYNSRLSSITGGQGSYTLEESHYEIVPSNVQQQLIAAAKKEAQADKE